MLFEYVIKITPQALAVLNEGLMLVPYGRAAPVVADLNEQLNAQVQARREQAADDAPAATA